MDIKVGAAEFTAVEVDPAEEIKSHQQFFRNKASYLIDIMRQFQAQERFDVGDYNCFTKTVNPRGQDAKARLPIAKNMKIVGVDKNREATQEATQKLAVELVTKAGFSQGTEFTKALNGLFGAHFPTVPWDDLINQLGPHSSFYVYARIEWIYYELTPKWKVEPGAIFLAVPYHVSFEGQQYFHCNFMWDPTWWYYQTADLPGMGLNPTHKETRKAVFKRISKLIESAEDMIRRDLNYMDKLRSDERLEEDRRKVQLKEVEQRIEDTKRRIAPYKDQARKLSGD